MEISKKELLTRDFLIDLGDGTYTTNKYGDVWQLCWHVVLTEGNKFLGRINIEGPQLTLYEYNTLAILHSVEAAMQKELDTKIAAQEWRPIIGI